MDRNFFAFLIGPNISPIIGPILLLLAACSTPLKKPPSEPAAETAAAAPATPADAYQLALNNAFADLQARGSGRDVAAVGAGPKRDLPGDLTGTQRFMVRVQPKSMKLGLRPDQPRTETLLEQAQDFQFRINRIGGCGSAGSMVPESVRAECLQVDIRPLNPKLKGQKFARIFISPEYRAYGLAYHDFVRGEEGESGKSIKTVRWDPVEPLSSEMMPLQTELFPLDLPIYASNSKKAQRENIAIESGPRKGQSCDGWKYRYKNVYGSRVKVHWCSGDPWPTVIETNRYLATLSAER